MKLKTYLVKLIELYQKYISRFTKRSCAYYPTCSEYAKQAIEKYGAAKGTFLACRRVLRCHPWVKNHMDPLN